MPIPLEAHVAFNEKYNDDNGGGRWTLEGRDYILNEIWRPLQSYHLYPRNPEEATRLCPLCRAQVMTEQLESEWKAPPRHPRECPGLETQPIVMVGANAPRREGKTKNAMAYAFSTIFLERFKKIAFIASAADQAEELVENNLAAQIRQHPKLDARAHITASKIEVPGKGSWFEVLAKSAASVTGRGFTHIFFDECRDLDAKPFMALLASIFASHGVECPSGHGSWAVLAHGPSAPEKCPHCGGELSRWFPRVLAMSASGEVQDVATRDWFDAWIQQRKEKPEPGTRVWRTETRENPSVSKKVVGVVHRSFSDVPGVSHYAEIEIGNKPLRSGEIYVEIAQVNAITDYRLRDQDASTRAAVAFLDTSKTGDKTSLVICVEDDDPIPEALKNYKLQHDGKLLGVAFEFLALRHLKVWDPQNIETCPGGFVDPATVEKYLDYVVPRFTRLLKIKVDTRVMPWAKQLVANCQKKPWGRGRIEAYEGQATEDSAMYAILRERVFARTLRIPVNEELHKEFVSLRKVDLAKGTIKVIDANADKSGRNRRSGGIHRDIVMSLAGDCLLAHELQLEMPETMSSVEALDEKLSRTASKPIMGDIAKGGF